MENVQDGTGEGTIQPVTVEPRSGGEQRIYRFDNGYGASVIRTNYSYGREDGLWELGVIKFEGADEWHLTYNTPVADDVLGWLTDEDVQTRLRQIRHLPAVSQ